MYAVMKFILKHDLHAITKDENFHIEYTSK